MRIYNATDAQLNVPFSGGQRLTIGAHSVSGDIMGSEEFLSLLVTSYNTDEIALIVSGPYEINVCAHIPTAANYVVQSLDEALQKFNLMPEKKEEMPIEVVDECPAEKKVEEEVVEKPAPEVKKPTKKATAKKSTTKKA